jgi:hypothetical protein
MKRRTFVFDFSPSHVLGASVIDSNYICFYRGNPNNIFLLTQFSDVASKFHFILMKGTFCA